jgi:hypothetical protein
LVTENNNDWFGTRERKMITKNEKKNYDRCCVGSRGGKATVS